ncbi:uncharacterized protein LOC122296630 [Carya illinoinensis]|uniref:uncharacterized protein LOC122296630 n=1 Tax=Carya illinoinensis TaxID=32201 RepID=UPI001C724BA2|nr:uncharacterized protein LOC122296630 [Carya illinoinensis]
MSAAYSEIMWLRGILSELGFAQTHAMPFHGDNTSVIQIAANPVFHEQTKHVKVNCHYIRDAYESKDIILPHVSSEHQVVDIFTKLQKDSGISVTQSVEDDSYNGRLNFGRVNINEMGNGLVQHPHGQAHMDVSAHKLSQLPSKNSSCNTWKKHARNQLIVEMFNKEEAMQICNIPISFLGGLDESYWGYTSDKTFSARSACYSCVW